jgi:hypothetical protein
VKNKWSKGGYFVTGDGSVIILETVEEKTNGLKKILEQQAMAESINNINENEIINLFLFKVIVKSMNIAKY